MKIRPIGLDNGDTERIKINRELAEARKSTSQIDQSRRTQVELGNTAPPPSQPDSTDEQLSGKAKGVLRLLQEGHFKGVADVRLRINFFDELSAEAAANAAPAAQEGSVDLVNVVRAAIEGMAQTLSLDEETQAILAERMDEFSTVIASAVEEHATSEGVDVEALASSIQAAFEALISELADSLSPPVEEDDAPPDVEPNLELQNPDGLASLEAPNAPEDGGDITPTDDVGPGGINDDSTLDEEPPLDGSDPVDPGVPPVVPGDGDDSIDDSTATLDEALASLTAAFDAALTSLLASISSSTQLSDPSPPSGNGGAYDKFLAMYNELRGVEPLIDEQS